jgi:hypothetical protein
MLSVPLRRTVALMTFWQVINSPFVLTIVTLLVGGLAASTISAMWQRRAQQHAVKLQYSREILATYQAYVRRINGDRERLSGDGADELHAQMLSQAKLARFLFRDPRVGEGWKTVAADLTDAAGFKRSGHDEKASRRMIDVYRDADLAIEATYQEIRR